MRTSINVLCRCSVTYSNSADDSTVTLCIFGQVMSYYFVAYFQHFRQCHMQVSPGVYSITYLLR